MNLAAVWKVVNDRLVADATLVAALTDGTGGVYNNQIVPGASFPYVVYNVALCTEEPAYRAEGQYIQLRLSVYDTKVRGLDRVNTILTRIYGDSQAQSYGQPSYGLHRWSPTLAGSWVSSALQRIDQTQAHEEDVWHFIETYDLHIGLN